MVMRLMRYLFHYCDYKKRSFQSKMHQKPSGGRRGAVEDELVDVAAAAAADAVDTDTL